MKLSTTAYKTASPWLVETPCEDGCPVSLKCHAYISLTKDRNLEEAYRAVRQRLPFPRVLGRICDHPCERVCRRGLVDEPVAIRDLKRVIADYAHANGIKYRPTVKANRPEKVAIIGSGPAGLAAAYDLARQGFQVTVYEALPVAGGMMAVGCPDYKLPKDILKDEIKSVTDLGVEIKLNTRVTDLDSLFQQGYQVILLALGTHKGKKPTIPGSDLEDVLSAVSFLRAVNLGETVKLGRRVIVIGGGNVAIDCARAAVRLHTDEVSIVCPETHEKMPAYKEEIRAAEDEGVKINTSLALSRISSEGGKVTGVECLQVKRMGLDSEGNLKVATVKGSERILPTDTVIFATGQGPQVEFLPGEKRITLSSRGFIVADARLCTTSTPGVFAAGDAVTNAGSVIKAIADGQRAALSITSYLNGKGFSPTARREDDHLIIFPSSIPKDEKMLARKSRTPVSLLPIKLRKNSFEEVCRPYSTKEAIEEASRCIRCDLVGSTLWDVSPIKDVEKYSSLITREGMAQSPSVMRLSLMGGLDLRMNPAPEKADNVIMTGCFVWGTPYPLMSYCRIFKYFGMPFALLRHEKCCGAPMLFAAEMSGCEADLRNGEKSTAEFNSYNIDQAKSLGAKTIWHICTWCAYIYNRFHPKAEVENRFHLDFLVQIVKELNPRLEFNDTVAYFPGGRHRKHLYMPGAWDYDWDSYREMLGKVRGLKVVDLAPYCCVTHPEITLKTMEEKGITTLVTPCVSCYGRLMRRAPAHFRVLTVSDLFLEALTSLRLYQIPANMKFGKTRAR